MGPTKAIMNGQKSGVLPSRRAVRDAGRSEIHLVRCPDCGGMGIRSDEFTVESDCIRCTVCEHEFDARLEMMET